MDQNPPWPPETSKFKATRSKLISKDGQRELVAFGPAMPEIMQGRYRYLEEVGKGDFSHVYKTEDLEKGEIVAVKRIRYKKTKNGVPSAVIREVSLLKELNHDNIVRLLDVYPTAKETCLVFEYMKNDLGSWLSAEIKLDSRVTKNFMLQILRGVAFCHSQKIFHRDLKPGNILVDITKQVVKISDFGISREVTAPLNAYSPEVGTTPYMAPEMLFGCRKYSYPVDIWSVGCIFGEMATGHKLFPPSKKYDQIQNIFRVLGTPNEETWPGITRIYPNIARVQQFCPTNLEDIIQGLEPDGVNLLSEMVRWDPRKRITADDALEHPYFSDLKSSSL